VVELNGNCGPVERNAAGSWCLHFFFCAEDARFFPFFVAAASMRSTQRTRDNYGSYHY
jgi:hypothetical protein